MKKLYFHKNLFNYNIMVITAFWGASLVSINLGVAQLTIYRILLIINLIVGIRYYAKKKKILNKYLIYIELWIIYSLITVLLAEDKYAWIRSNFFLITGYLSVIVIASYYDSQDKLIKLNRYLSFFGKIYVLAGFYENIAGKYLFAADNYFNQALDIYHLRPPIFVAGNPNNYSLTVLIFIYIFIIENSYAQNRVKRVLNLVIIAISIYLIIISGSRAVIIAGLISSFIFESFGIRNKIFVWSAFAFVLLLSIRALFHFGILEFNADIFGSDMVRLNLIRNGFVFLKRTLFIGVGSGNAEYWVSHYAKYYTGGITNLHNWWMEILVTNGIISLTLYIIFLVKIIEGLISNVENKIVLKSYISSIIGFMIGSITVSSNMQTEWQWVYYAILIATIRAKPGKYSNQIRFENVSRLEEDDFGV